ncbi:hypothetical protein D3C72_1514830 [compost metagenome]
MVVGAVHKLGGQCQVGLAVLAVLALGIGEEAPGGVHGLGFYLHQGVGGGFGLGELGQFGLGEALAAHQLQQRYGLALGEAAVLAGGEEVEVRALVFLRPGLLAVADGQHLAVERLEVDIAGHRQGAGHAGEVVGALPQLIGQQVRLVAVFLAFAELLLVVDEQDHQQAEQGGAEDDGAEYQGKQALDGHGLSGMEPPPGRPGHGKGWGRCVSGPCLVGSAPAWCADEDD